MAKAAPKKGLELQQQLLNKAIKPTTDPAEQKRNQQRMETLKKVNSKLSQTNSREAPGSGRFGLSGGSSKTSSSTELIIPRDGEMSVNNETDQLTVGPDGTPNAQEETLGGSAEGDYVPSYEEMGEGLIQSEYDADVSTADDLDIGPVYGSLDEQFQDMISQQREQKALQEAQIEEQQDQNNYDTSQSKNAMEGGLETSTGQLSANREGFSSQTNVSATERLKKATGDRMDRLLQASSVANAALEQAKKDLARAEKSGNSELVQKYRGILASATAQAEQIDTSYIAALTDQVNAETEAQKTKAAVTQSGLTLFQDAVDTGNEMSYGTVKGYADQLGLPTDLLMGYYQGAQEIRDNKALTNDEKTIANQQNLQNLTDQVNGLRTESAKNIDYLTQLRQMGASEEMISAFKSMAGITDYDDPLTSADLEYKNLENEIKRKQMAGEPVSLADYETLFDLQQKINEAAGTGGNAYISPSIDGISMTYEGGQLNLTLPKNADGSLKAYQCGEFVNRAWGLTSGSNGGFGDTYNEKMGIVDSNGFRTEGKNLVELSSMVVPGMAGVMQAGDTGHVFLVKSGVDANGNFQTYEANVGDNNPYTPDPPMIKTRNVKDLDITGFAYPPNGETVSGNGETETMTLEQVPKDLRTAVTTKVNSFDSEPTVKSFQKVQEGWSYISGLDPETSTSSDNQALIYAFAKIMDPDSVVREGEYATIQKYSQSWAESFGFNAARVVDNVEFLGPEAIANMKKTLESKYNVSKAGYEQVRNEYIRTVNNLATVDVAESLLQDYSYDYSGGGDEADEDLDPDSLSSEYDPIKSSLYQYGGINQ